MKASLALAALLALVGRAGATPGCTDARQGRWVIGNTGESCTTACSALGSAHVYRESNVCPIKHLRCRYLRLSGVMLCITQFLDFQPKKCPVSRAVGCGKVLNEKLSAQRGSLRQLFY